MNHESEMGSGEVQVARDAWPPPFYSTIPPKVVHPRPSPLPDTWYVPTQYFNPRAVRLCCSPTENRCNPGSSSEAESESEGRKCFTSPLEVATVKTGEANRKRGGRGGLSDPGVLAAVCSGGSVSCGCRLSLCCHSHCSPVPAGGREHRLSRA